MSNSNLVAYTLISPHRTVPRNHAIDTITIHVVDGNLSIETIGKVFQRSEASSNYGVGSDGRIGMYVEEQDRSWASSNRANDHRAITIEVANDGPGPEYHVSDAAMASLIKLCADICKRNNIKELKWQGDKSLIGQVDKQNMTVHRWFAAKACPGEYLYNKQGYIASEVNKLLGAAGGPVAPTQPASPTPSSLVAALPTNILLKKGSSGSNVKILQADLNKILGTNIATDGVFGGATENTVITFQKKYGLSVDGKAGKHTITKINELIGTRSTTEFRVQVTTGALNVRSGPSAGYKVTTVIRDKGVYTIVEQSGSWGRLKSGAGWICLDYTKRV